MSAPLLSPDAREALTRAYRAGKTVSELADTFQVSETTVRRALPERRRNGPPPKVDGTVLAELRRRGYTWPQIASMVGMDRSAAIRAYSRWLRHSRG